VGRYRVRLVQLDSSLPGQGPWDPGMVEANAKRARDDGTAIAYLGELDYGASAVSLPVTNAAGILQVSPGDGLTSLTRGVPGRPRDGPERYYPSRRRTFLRLVPPDLVEADRLVDLARGLGTRRVAILAGEDIYGRELASQLSARAERAGITVSDVEDLDDRPATARSTVSKLAATPPDALMLAAVAGPGTAALAGELRRRLPHLPVLAGSGLLARPLPAGLGRVEVLSAVRPLSQYPARGRHLAGRLGGTPALYGYESMSLVLKAVRAAGPSRRGVVRAVFAGRAHRSVIGTYAVARTGDVSERRLALYRSAP
jgi:ABC-type branched-subunit amino acid transport system substrate-binding protein